MTETYKKRIEELEETIKVLKKKDNYFSAARLVSFLFFAFTVIITAGTPWHILKLFLALIALGLFVKVVLIHLNNIAALTIAQTRKKVLENEISCIEKYKNSYYDGFAFQDGNHDFTSDMDVFGKSSLFHYLNRCATGHGNKVLSRWLKAPAPLQEIRARQKAVEEFAHHHKWFEDIQVTLYPRKIREFDTSTLPTIKKTMPTPKNTTTGIIISYTLLAVALAAIIFTPLGAGLLLFPVFFNIVFNSRLADFTKNIRAQIEGRQRTLEDYQHILFAFEAQPFKSDYLLTVKQELKQEDTSATEALKELQKLGAKLDYTLNMILKAILNLLFVWDIIICRKISRWFDRYAEKTDTWFEVVGKIEALISLARVRLNHPQWALPVYTDEEFHFLGEKLGHPLLPEKQRVCNDFIQPGKVDIITGSNMAGKSTFLRTIGVNIILAGAGSVVCAQKLALSHFRIITYLTITDSLTENTSTFYREIKRLKMILESTRNDNNVLLLLDELLRGTNSADKAKGSMAITRELIKRKIPSLIATHNLELAAMQERYPSAINNYYFDIVVGNDNQMQFDYLLKPGICNTFNASLLLKEIGIDISEST